MRKGRRQRGEAKGIERGPMGGGQTQDEYDPALVLGTAAVSDVDKSEI